MNLAHSLEIAVGIIIAVLVLVALHWLATAQERAARNRKHREMHEELNGAVSSFLDDMHAEMVKEREAEAAKKNRRRAPAKKPATKKAPAKTVAKKGASNVKATSTRK